MQLWRDGAQQRAPTCPESAQSVRGLFPVPGHWSAPWDGLWEAWLEARQA